MNSVISEIQFYNSISLALLSGTTYFILWAVSLGFYPYSRWLQANCFWHPKLRRIFFLFNPLLTAVPQFRRRLFAPFDQDLRPKPDSTETNQAWFSETDVVEDPIRRREISVSEEEVNVAKKLRLSSVFSYVKGHVVLVGESGLGKTTYLRRLARYSTEPVVYLEARACKDGVTSAIRELLPGWLNDQDFLESLIFQGGLCVIIDGFNEVEPMVREKIRGFFTRAASVRSERNRSILIGRGRSGCLR